MKFFKKISDFVTSKKEDPAKPYNAVLEDPEFTKEVIRSHFFDFDKNDQAKIILLLINSLHNHINKDMPIDVTGEFIEDIFGVDFDDYRKYFIHVTPQNYDTEIKSILKGPQGSIVNDIIVFAINYFKKY